MKTFSLDVKRDDLYCTEHIAPLAKMRGVHLVMNRLKEEGVETVGVFDFKVSKAGVGIAAMAHLLGMWCVECYQHYKSYDTDGLPEQQLRCKAWGAELFPIPASRININYAIAKKHVETLGGYMFPKGIVLEETIDSMAREVAHDREQLAQYDHIVINAGSGTIVTGLLKGLIQNSLFPQVYAVCCTNDVKHCKRLYSFLEELPAAAKRTVRVRVLPSEFEYYTECHTDCPFPAHPNYDRKAWHWLLRNFHRLEGNVLFWNIGA